MKIVILAGGSGTRLWPWSRDKKPKQILTLFGLGEKSLLHETYSRLRRNFPGRDIYVSTHKKYSALVKSQLPALPTRNLLLESEKKGSAGAIALAAAFFYAANPQEIMVTVHSDQWLKNHKKFAAALKAGEKLLKRYPQKTFLAGLKPRYPETGYGYIRAGKKFVQIGKERFFAVTRFLEKPNLARAKRFSASGEYFWNPGWFGWRVDHLLELFAKYSPGNFAVLRELAQPALWRRRAKLDQTFKKFKEGVIEKMILERDRNLVVLPVDIDWADIGHWRSIKEMAPADQDGNVVNSQSILLASRNNLFLSAGKKFIASIGIENLALIETDDIILLANLKQAQKVKDIVERIKRRPRLSSYL